MFELNGYEWKANTTNYKEDQMLYTVNKHGFRGDNFSTKDDAIMFLGCSFTFGIGVQMKMFGVEMLQIKETKSVGTWVCPVEVINKYF